MDRSLIGGLPSWPPLADAVLLTVLVTVTG